LFAIIQAAGWPIWPLLIASVIGLALIIERFIHLRRSRVMPAELLTQVVHVYRTGKVNAEVIETLEKDSPLGYVLAAGLRNVNAPRPVMKEAIEEAGGVAVHKLSKSLTALGTIASLAPLMGLFGTVVGMIEIFAVQDVQGTNPAQLAHGISIALYNTGFGLAIAIPALMFYRYFRAVVENYVVEMEQQAIKFVDIVQGARR
jgi:biopolymer transport protein ExbB